MSTLEQIQNSDKKYIVGVDEVGTGCLAGPTYVCAFKAPKEWVLDGVRDSKKLTPKRRESLSAELCRMKDKSEVNFKIASASSAAIDQEGILNAVHRLYHEAIESVGLDDSVILIDGKKFKESRYEYIALVGGDDLVKQISAASVLAKVARDSYMVAAHDLHPMYDWKQNKGYGVKKHLDALKEYGVSPLHRRSYEPIKTMVQNKE